MAEDSKESFRVVDKRRFNDEADSSSVSSGDAQKKQPESLHRQPESLRAPEETITYSSFVFSLGMQGLVMMGEGGMPGVPEGKPEVNLPAARETIELLSLLKEKTKGNLNPDEEKLTDEILSSLRMTYVKKAK